MRNGGRMLPSRGRMPGAGGRMVRTQRLKLAQALATGRFQTGSMANGLKPRPPAPNIRPLLSCPRPPASGPFLVFACIF
jgi:hypothetical protein